MKVKNVILFLIFGHFVKAAIEKNNEIENDGVLSIFENSFVHRIGDATYYITKMLADYNDRNLGSSEWGKVLGYEEMKPKSLDDSSRKGRGIKKMSMAMMPLVFHVGATSTWMLITSIMAAKSVAIGLLLLVFKIAVSSAKVASFFTLLKSKHADHDHHDAWAWGSPHHGHDRSLARDTPHGEWSSYSPEWMPSDHNMAPPDYKTISTYKENSISSSYDDGEYEDKPQNADKMYS